MGSLNATSVAEVWEAIKKYDGVPRWWAELFVNIGLSATDAVIWVNTASADSESPLSVLREKNLNDTLKSYATARGISLLGAGDGDSVESTKADRLIHWVSTVTNPEEQEAIIREVGGYADVRFKENAAGVYSSHAVANAVRSVHQAYQRKAYGSDAIVLEAGASLKSAVLAGVDAKRYHCCCPVLDVRDSVRHSLRGWLTMVANSESGFKESSRVAARAALDPDAGFVCRRKTQDCTKEVEVICSNESTHDIPFDDLPKVMARHGARLWVGFATRAPGARRVGGPVEGKCPVFGTRWRIDHARDTISFHFKRDGCFSYVHKFSEWISYEEKFGFRWYGKYFDYVYSRLPITTAASLAFVVVRVPKAPVMLNEPVYKASHLSGYVEVTSIKSVGGCVGVANPVFEPFTFGMETLVFDRVLETRLAQGDRGNLAATMSYMRSVKVKLIVGGVALGAVSTVPTDVLEPAAVAVEVLAADMRRAGERDYESIINASSGEVASANVLKYFSGLSRYIGYAGAGFVDVLRNSLAKALQGPNSIVVKAQRCSSFVKVDNGLSTGVLREADALEPTGCGCNELIAVKAALKTGTSLTSVERKELMMYMKQLEQLSASCVNHEPFDYDEEAPEVYYDAEDNSVVSDTSRSELTRSNTSSGLTVETENTSVSPDVLGECEKGLDVEQLSPVMQAMDEYARWARQAVKCTRTEAARWCDVLFQVGNPTVADVERSSTARTRHAVVAIVNSRVVSVVGAFREGDDFSEVYVRSLRRTCVIHLDAMNNKFVKEPVNELCYTNSDMRVMNGDALHRGVKNIMHSLPATFDVPRYRYVCGVPGSGKTYEIVQSLIADIKQGRNVVYLTTTTASKEMVEKTVRDQCDDCEGFVARTYDSYVINGASLKGTASFHKLYLDEAAMAHKGQLFACIANVCAADVVLYGDPMQLPWMSFMAQFDEQHAVIADEFVKESRCVTHRFGARVCAMWLDVYDQIYPCDCHDHTDEVPEVIRVTGGASVPQLPKGKTLTFTQEEKMMVKRELGLTKSVVTLKTMDENGLSTVGEDQGGTHEEVQIVRLVNKKNPKESAQSPSIYNRQPWVLVGTTRHKSRLKYYTVAQDDLVVARFELAVCPVRYNAVLERRRWSDVANFASQVRKFGV